MASKRSKAIRKQWRRKIEKRRLRYPGLPDKCPKGCPCDCHDPDLHSMNNHPYSPCPGKFNHVQETAAQRNSTTADADDGQVSAILLPPIWT